MGNEAASQDVVSDSSSFVEKMGSSFAVSSVSAFGSAKGGGKYGGDVDTRLDVVYAWLPCDDGGDAACVLALESDVWRER